VTRLGEFFCYRKIANFGQFLENSCMQWQKFSATFFHGKSFVFILTNNGLGSILGVFSQTHLVTLVLMKNFKKQLSLNAIMSNLRLEFQRMIYFDRIKHKNVWPSSPRNLVTQFLNSTDLSNF
jgi:hypothetical protein